MARTKVCSWRVAADLKAALEDAASEKRTSVGGLLGRMARQWLRARAAAMSKSDAVQRRIRASAKRFIGSLSGRNPRRAEGARREIRERLAKRRASTVFTIDHGDFDTYRRLAGGWFRVVPGR